jgi:mannonate dehydratase
MNRRTLLKAFSAGTIGAAAQWPAWAQAALRGLPPLTIRDVRVILTAPNGIRLVVVKVETSEPGLYGLGCATFTQRAFAVATAVQEYLRPFLIGKDAGRIEDIWQSSFVSSYWRNGPVLNNAMSGVDMALWDIQGKRANMPVYQLLGGKCRESADVYNHASGRDFQEVADNVRKWMDQGYRYVRAQVAVPGQSTYGARGAGAAPAQPGQGARPRAPWEPAAYVRLAPKLFEFLRANLGDEVELLHDVHERVALPQAVRLCKDLEPYRLFFLEDPLPPEEIDHFRIIRQQCSTPLAMGELFNNPHEFVPLISNRLIDFIRIHLSQIGGLSPARKVAALGEYFGVRTAWHGPGDVSPVGHAANLALDLACYNFGIQECTGFGANTREVFPGCPEIRDGAMWAGDAPGLGVDLDEKLAAKFPAPPVRGDDGWGSTRRRDGTVIRP